MKNNKEIDQSFNDFLLLPSLTHQKTIQLAPQIRRHLSQQTKDNFLQFLVVQKAGKPGDIDFLERMKNDFSKEFRPKFNNVSKKNVSYLRLQDENEKQIQKYTQQILSGRHVRALTPLDEYIKKKHEKVRSPIENQLKISKSGLDIFNI